MKKILGFILLFFSLFVYSCDDDKGLGDWESMDIDKTQAEVGADGGTLTFKCSNYNWWVGAIEIHENGVERVIYTTNFIEFENAENEWFTLSFPGEDRKTLQVDLKPNPDSTERKLILEMTFGNAFGNLYITQKGK